MSVACYVSSACALASVCECSLAAVRAAPDDIAGVSWRQRAGPVAARDGLHGRSELRRGMGLRREFGLRFGIGCVGFWAGLALGVRSGCLCRGRLTSPHPHILSLSG